jgi:hypothetical protein
MKNKKVRRFMKKAVTVVFGAALAVTVLAGSIMDVHAEDITVNDLKADDTFSGNDTSEVTGDSTYNVYYYTESKTEGFTNGTAPEGSVGENQYTSANDGTTMNPKTNNEDVPEYAGKTWKVAAAGNDGSANYISVYKIEPSSQPSTTSDTSSTSKPKPTSPPSHRFDWVTVEAATASSDGLEQYICRDCGLVAGSRVIPSLSVFTSDTISAISNASEGSDVTIYSGNCCCFNGGVISAIAAMKGGHVILNFSYGGTDYTISIPGGLDLSKYLTGGGPGYIGFMYLKSIVEAYAELGIK